MIQRGAAPQLAGAAGRIAARVEVRLRSAAATTGAAITQAVPRRSSVVQQLEPTFAELLRDLPGLVSGAGFLAKPGLFSDAHLHHSWWVLAGDATAMARVNLDDSSDSFYDYPTKEFFRIPAVSGQLAVMGPYVDYLGTGGYILTWGCPVHISGAFIGTVGADVTLHDLQSQLMSEVAEPPDTEVLVNGKGRIVYSTSAELESGTMFRSADFTSWTDAGDRVPTATDTFEIWPCAGLPWAAIRLTELRR
jgi:hypothetical protein